MYNPRKNIAAPANVNQPKPPQKEASISFTPPSLTFSPLISKELLPTTTVDDLLKKMGEQAAALNKTKAPSPKT